MSNILVVDNTGAVSNTQQRCEYSVIGFRTIWSDSAYTGQAEDPLYPFANTLDFPDNTKYSPLASSGTVVIEISQGALTEIDYFGMSIHNAQSAGLNAKLEHWNGASWDLLTEFTSLQDDKPYMSVFSPVQSRKQRLTLTFTSKLYIGTMFCGKALTALSTPSLGFQPAKYGIQDEVEQFTTEGNQTVMGRRIPRGWQAKGSFDYVPLTVLDTFYVEYQNWVLDSKPIFFKWSNLKDEVMFGRQNVDRLTKPKYKTAYHADIDFEINGIQ